jgi:hypothetical protein
MKRVFQVSGSLVMLAFLVAGCSSGDGTAREDVGTIGLEVSKCAGGTPGDSNYCSSACTCDLGEGDCDSNSECASGLACVGKGLYFCYSTAVNVCAAAHCGNKVKDGDETQTDCGGSCGTCCPDPCANLPADGRVGHCTVDCACDAREGDCAADSNKCSAGLQCYANVGAQFGFATSIDVCLASHCSNGVKDGDEKGIDCGPSCAACPPSICDDNPCDDGNPCTDTDCDPITGCLFTPLADGTSCSDANACTSGDSCQAGACTGTAAVCNDDNACTTDTCESTTGCVFTNVADDATCDDGNACTSGDSCQSGACTGTATVCSDNNACTTDMCDAATGCVFTNLADDAACDDGQPCTTGDKCVAGACTGDAVVCDDSNACTTDTCDPTSGCVFNDNGTCPVAGTGGTGGTSGDAGSAGAAGAAAGAAGASGAAGAADAPGEAGAAGAVATEGAGGTGGVATATGGTGGSATGTGGSATGTGGSATGTGGSGAVGTGGSAIGTGGSGAVAGAAGDKSSPVPEDDGACGCRVPAAPASHGSWLAAALFALAGTLRRRGARAEAR